MPTDSSQTMELLTIAGVAEFLKISKSTVRRLQQQRLIPFFKPNASGRPDRNNGFITFVVRTLYNKPTRHLAGAMECLLHGADSPPNQSARHPPNCIKSESEPHSNAD
jgi:hypothetical protein